MISVDMEVTLIPELLMASVGPVLEEHLKCGLGKNSSSLIMCHGGHFIQPSSAAASLVCAPCVLAGKDGTTFRTPLLYYEALLEALNPSSVASVQYDHKSTQ